MQKKDRSRKQDASNTNQVGSLMVPRVEEIGNEEVSQMNKEMTDFTLYVARREKWKIINLTAKYEKVLEAYDEIRIKMSEMENAFTRYEKQHRG